MSNIISLDMFLSGHILSKDVCSTWLTYVYGPIPLLHVVRCQEVGYRRQSMKKAILEAKDGSRTNDGCFRKDTAHNFLTSSLSLISISHTYLTLYSI